LIGDVVGDLGLNFELFPPPLFGKSYLFDQTYGIFPHQANGPASASKAGNQPPHPLAQGTRLIIAMEDPLHHMEFERHDGGLVLFDGRETAHNGWFVLRAPVGKGSIGVVVSLSIKLHRLENWTRPPVMLFSQVGYHPEGEKRILVELDPEGELPGPVSLERLDPLHGTIPVCVGSLQPWGKFLCYDYALFDFTVVRQPGLYQLKINEQPTPPFPIAEDVFHRNVWQPTLDTHLPVQMCHMAVMDGMRIWHGACHLDDALQAPLNQVHFDSYRQSHTTETPFQPLEHIPFLDRGGWHDAGDFDLAAGSQAGTTLTLALAQEAFKVSRDQTTVLHEQRLVLLHQPDGIPDMVQQIVHGVENLLSGYRALKAHGEAGRTFIGIIEDTLERYALLGDTASMTDNRVYDPGLNPLQVQGDRSGKKDDRWVFTNRNTSLEYHVISALAAASRVIDEWYEELARECLETALQAWEAEQARPLADEPNCYIPGKPDAREILAAIELYLASGETRFIEHLLSEQEGVFKNFHLVAWSVARILDRIEDTAFIAKFINQSKVLADEITNEMQSNPFGVPFHPHVWGVGWSIQYFAVYLYYLVKRFPEFFSFIPLQRALNYLLGCHPASNTSLVSGVGAHSLLVAYGQNRADWSYIPGGVASGPNLVRPDFPELIEPYPYIWQQSEYVIGGAASHIFLTLAVDELLSKG
jgi:endoglucanase